MSGIAAIIHFDGKPADPGDIAAMVHSMAHRGPDDLRHGVYGSVALGHCMMRTTAESLAEVQPLINERGNVRLVVDGWLANWEELRSEVLRCGGMLRNRSDAELILAAYEIWGEDCVVHLEGDFAFVIWDAKRQAAFCARDRMGNKALNYFWSGKTLVVASEPRGLLALPWIPCSVNEGLLAERLSGEWISRTETLWKDVTRLVAAHRMTASRSGLQQTRYWQPDTAALIHYKSDEEYFQHYRYLFLDSVRRASRSHRPVAYEVSGGLDSSAIFCGAKHLHDSHRLPAPAIQGYTLDYGGDAFADELDYVKAVSRFLGVVIPAIEPTVMPLSWYAERARYNCDQAPWPNAVHANGLRKAARSNDSRVLINGGGGDEWLAGSRGYYAEELSHWRIGNVGRCLGTDIRSIGLPGTTDAFLRHGVFPLLPGTLQNLVRTALRKIDRRDPAPTWLTPRLRTIAEERRHRPPDFPHSVSSFSQRGILEMLYKQAARDWGREEDDRLNSTLGLEIRYPLDTPAMVQFAISTPERLRMKGDRTKFIHLQALHDLLPEELLHRRTKSAFSNVVRRHLDELENWFRTGAPAQYPEYLDPLGMARSFDDYQANPNHGRPMWVLLTIHGCLQPLRRLDEHVYTSELKQNVSARVGQGAPNDCR